MSEQEILAIYGNERQKCEVWSRVMGYHRPIESWNPGKQQEFADRKMFVECANASQAGNQR